MKDAYQVSQLREETIPPLQAFYLATLGGARALHLSDRIGSFRPGYEADFLVLNPAATPLLHFRSKKNKNTGRVTGRIDGHWWRPGHRKNRHHEPGNR